MSNHSIAVPAHGTKWEVENPQTAGAWVAIKGIKTFARNEVAPSVNDETNLDSTFAEKEIGIPDAGQVNLTVQYNRADPGQAILQAAKASAALLTIRVTLTDGSIETLKCYVLTFPFSGQANGGGLEGTIVLEVTGEPVWS